ncbi:hypothetical protein [Pseudomonas fluorescens]|nr:hypothetical protein [Pseudomonas fluorescens]TCV61732.1 hypothetical protein EDB98_114157 [Pseudomonas fluorescens]
MSTIIVFKPIHCGGELARDEARAFNDSADEPFTLSYSFAVRCR